MNSEENQENCRGMPALQWETIGNLVSVAYVAGLWLGDEKFCFLPEKQQAKWAC
jgi:hypothetical protein